MSHHLAPEDALVLGEPQVDAGSARLQVRQLWQEAVDSAEDERKLLLFTHTHTQLESSKGCTAPEKEGKPMKILDKLARGVVQEAGSRFTNSKLNWSCTGTALSDGSTPRMSIKSPTPSSAGGTVSVSRTPR